MALTASEIKAYQGEFAVLSYKDVPSPPAGFRVVATSLDMNSQAVNDTGYFGVVFEHIETGTLFISHRGTEWTDSGDLANDNLPETRHQAGEAAA